MAESYFLRVGSFPNTMRFEPRGPRALTEGIFEAENRNGLVVDACLTEANGHAERIAALHMIEPRADRPRPITLGADKALRRRGLRQ